MISRHAEKETGKASPVRIEPALTPHQFQEYFLRYFLGNLSLPAHSQCKPVYGTLVPAVQSQKRIPKAERETLALAAAKIAAELGVDVNAANADGRTALDAAQALQYQSVAQYLSDKGARASGKLAPKEVPVD